MTIFPLPVPARPARRERALRIFEPEIVHVEAEDPGEPAIPRWVIVAALVGLVVIVFRSS